MPCRRSASYRMAKDEVTPDKLKEGIAPMLRAHQTVVIQLPRLMEAAESEKRYEYVHLAEKLICMCE